MSQNIYPYTRFESILRKQENPGEKKNEKENDSNKPKQQRYCKLSM